MATLRKRGSKWHVQVRRSGQSQTRSFTHKADAEAWGRKIERAFDTGEITPHSDQLKAITVGELLLRYRDEVMSLKRGAAAELTLPRTLDRPEAELPVLQTIARLGCPMVFMNSTGVLFVHVELPVERVVDNRGWLAAIAARPAPVADPGPDTR